MDLSFNFLSLWFCYYFREIIILKYNIFASCHYKSIKRNTYCTCSLGSPDLSFLLLRTLSLLWFSGKPVHQLVQQTVFTELFFILIPWFLTVVTIHIFYYSELQRSSLYCCILLACYISLQGFEVTQGKGFFWQCSSGV